MISQINNLGRIVFGKDEKMTINELCSLFLVILKDNHPEVLNFEGYKKYIKYVNSNNEIELILFRNITYMGNPHPHNKKRIQIPKWFQDFYFKYRPTVSNVRLIGVYTYDKNNIFVEFNIKDYIQNYINNSSAHVDINDLYNSVARNKFEKIDNFGNRIVVINKNEIRNYLTTIKI